MTTLMSKLHAQALRFAAEKKGVTALEYGLLASLIAAAIVAAVTVLGDNIAGVLNQIGNAIVQR